MPAAHAIAAVSSPPGRSLRGVIRLSGDDLSSLCRAVFGDVPPPRALTTMRTAFGLPCLVALFPAPHSYTGDDVLEIQLPGNPALLEGMLHYLGEAARAAHVDFRLAEPGEFTRRAFLGGKLDLTQAEGIAATISAISDAQLQAAALLRGGRLGQWAMKLVDQLAEALALVEAGVDFVDQDDVVAISPAALDERLCDLQAQLQQLTARSRDWATIEDLPWVVLVGPPNAGKSTLFNRLLGHERAVVSDTPGTTRDVLCEALRIADERNRPAEVMLVDLAGLGDTGGVLDGAMQDAAHEAIRRADLVIELVRPPSDSAPGGGRHSHILKNVRMSSGSRGASVGVLRVGAKADVVGYSPGECDVCVSAITGQGIDELRRMIARRVGDRAVTLSGEVLALQPRHAAALSRASTGIEHARALLADQLDAGALREMELVAAHLRQALDALGELGGQMSPDDVLGKVFATFCIGK